jgi:hypothetical protein
MRNSVKFLAFWFLSLHALPSHDRPNLFGVD